MATNSGKANFKEINNYPQGKTGGKVKVIPGPAKGRGTGNPTNGGGIVKPTNKRGM